MERRACGRDRELRVGVDASAAGAVLGLHLGAVTDGLLAVGLAGLLDGQVHGGAVSRPKRASGQVASVFGDEGAIWRTSSHQNRRQTPTLAG